MGSLKNKLIAFREAKKQYTRMSSKEIIRHITRANKIKHFEYVVYNNTVLNDDCIVDYSKADGSYYCDSYFENTYVPIVVLIRGRLSGGDKILLSGYVNNDSDYCILNDVHYDDSNVQGDYRFEDGYAYRQAMRSAHIFASESAENNIEYDGIYSAQCKMNEAKFSKQSLQNSLINARFEKNKNALFYHAFYKTIDAIKCHGADITSASEYLSDYTYSDAYQPAVDAANADTLTGIDQHYKKEKVILNV